MVPAHFTSLLWSTHYGMCFTVANVYLACYFESTIVLHCPPPLQGDISDIAFGANMCTETKEKDQPAEYNDKTLKRHFQIPAH